MNLGDKTLDERMNRQVFSELRERAACWAVNNMLTPASSPSARIRRLLEQGRGKGRLSESVSSRLPMDWQTTIGRGEKERTE